MQTSQDRSRAEWVSHKRRTRSIQHLVAAGLLLTIAAVAITYWRRRTQTTTPPVPRGLPPGLSQQLSGYTFTRSEGGREVFRLHADRTVANQGGRSILSGVTVEFFGLDGKRQDTLRTERCEYDALTGEFFCGGRVAIELNSRVRSSPRGPNAFGPAQPVFLETAAIRYRPHPSLVVTDAPVRWRFGESTGSGMGLTYSIRDGWLELNKHAVVDFPLSGSTAGSGARAGREARMITSVSNSGKVLRLSAGSLRYGKASGEVRLSAGVGISLGESHIAANSGVIVLDGNNRPVGAILSGDVKMTDTGRGIRAATDRVRAQLDPATHTVRVLIASGALQVERRPQQPSQVAETLRAQSLEVRFAGQRPSPVEGEASRDVVLTRQVAVERGAAKLAGQSYQMGRQSLAAQKLEFTFQPASSLVAGVATRGPGEFVWTSDGAGQGKRTATASRFEMTFDASGRLQTITGAGPTSLVFQPADGSPLSLPLRSTSDHLEAKLNSATQAVESVRQTGHVRMKQGERRARAAEAEFAFRSQTLVLTGHPLLSDPFTRVSARRLVVDLTQQIARGAGQVLTASRAVDHALPFAPTEPAPSRRRAPAGNQGQGETLFVLSDKVDADRNSSIVRYEGHVRAWRGDDVLEAPELTLDLDKKRMSARGPVLTAGLEAAPGEREGKDRSSASSMVSIRADHLSYLDGERHASYQGHVLLKADDAVLAADRLEAYFSGDPGPGQLERAIARGHVMAASGGRHATGDRADYFASQAKVVMTGGPPVLYNKDSMVSGRRLTFFLHDDKFIVDGGAGSRAVSKHRVTR